MSDPPPAASPDAEAPDPVLLADHESTGEQAILALASEDASDDPRALHMRARVAAALFGEPPPPPERIGRYRVLGHVGTGAMGEVFEAYDDVLTRKVAIKLLHRARRSELASARMLQEARSLAQLSHPNVVQVYEAGVLGDRTWIAMEYVRGRNLAGWLEASPRTDQEILAAFLEAGRGLLAIHEAGLVHRDFKPDNVLVDDRGRVKVADLGLVRMLAELEPAASHAAPSATAEEAPSVAAAHRLTDDGTVLGTPAYMSPQQLLGFPVDALGDQFSFCVACWEALFGARPFQGATLQQLHGAMIRGRFDAGTRSSRVTSTVRRALTRGLAYEPEERFGSMAELLAALQRRPRRGVLAGAVVLLLAVSSGAGAFLWNQERSACDTTPDPSELLPPASEDALRRAFSSAAPELASASADRALASMSDYAQRLVRAHEQVCAAPRASDPALRDLRLSCLDRRALALQALRVELEQADLSAVENAVDAVSWLPSLERCIALDIEDEPTGPSDASLRLELARAEAVAATGRAREAWGLAEAIVERARAVHDTPAEADGLALRARTSFELGELEAGVDTLEQALALTTVARLDERTTSTLVELAARGGRDLRDTRRTPGWLRQAEAWLQRTELDALSSKLELARGHLRSLSDPREAFAIFDRLLSSGSLSDDERVEATDGRAAASVELGDHARAADDYEALLELRRRRYGDEHPKTAAALYNLGIALDRAGRADALQRYQQAFDLWTRLHPAGHPDIARASIALGNAELARGALGRARDHARAALELLQRLAPEDVAMAEAWTLQGVVQHAAGEHEAALRSHEAALRIYAATLGADNHYTAIARSNAGEAMVLVGQWETAGRYFSEAISVLERVLGPENPTLAYPLKGQGVVALVDERPHDAVTLLQRARALSGPLRTIERDEIDLALGHALVAIGRATEGEALLREVIDATSSRGADEEARIQRFLEILSHAPRQQDVPASSP